MKEELDIHEKIDSETVELFCADLDHKTLAKLLSICFMSGFASAWCRMFWIA